MAWLFLHHCDQIPNKQLKGGKVYFGLQFLRVQFMIGFTDSGPVVRQSIMVAERKSQGQDSPQGPALSDVLPPGKSHLLRFPEPPKSCHQLGPNLQHVSLLGESFI
jgi:hypothetical protein